MKTICCLIFVAAICSLGNGCSRSSSSERQVGRYQLRTEDTLVVFDTVTGRIYIGRTNGTFVVRDPVLETKQPK